MNRILLPGIILATGLFWASTAPAGYIVTATTTAQLNVDGIDYDYLVTLKDDAASTSNIGTFWYSWLPGQDYMFNRPISVTNPAGWTSSITGGNAGNGFAIRWVAGAGSALTPGTSLTFGFTSAETPAQLAGFSRYFPTTPVGTSVVYSAGPFSDPGFQFVAAAPVPEPSSLVLSLLAGLGWFVRKRVVRLAWVSG